MSISNLVSVLLGATVAFTLGRIGGAFDRRRARAQDAGALLRELENLVNSRSLTDQVRRRQLCADLSLVLPSRIVSVMNDWRLREELDRSLADRRFEFPEARESRDYFISAGFTWVALQSLPMRERFAYSLVRGVAGGDPPREKKIREEVAMETEPWNRLIVPAIKAWTAVRKERRRAFWHGLGVRSVHLLPSASQERQSDATYENSIRDAQFMRLMLILTVPWAIGLVTFAVGGSILIRGVTDQSVAAYLATFTVSVGLAMLYIAPSLLAVFLLVLRQEQRRYS